MAKKTTKRVRHTIEQASKAQQVPARLSLRGISLVESSCKLGIIKTGQLPGYASQSVTVTLFKNTNDPTFFAVSLAIKLDASYDEDKTKEPAMAVFATFVANYLVEEIFDKENFEKILQQMAVHHLWPYWREFAQSMSIRMGLPPFPVPLIVVQEKAEDD